MNRFLKIRVSQTSVTIEDLILRAAKFQISSDKSSGFEIDYMSKSKLHLIWNEKIVITRHIESEIFGVQKFEEVKIVSFGIIFFERTSSIVLMDPPLGRHVVHRVLRNLFDSSNFIFEKLNIELSADTLSRNQGWKITSIQTECEGVVDGINLSFNISGGGDLKNYFNNMNPGSKFEIKSLSFSGNLKSGSIKIQLFSTGLIKFSRDVTREDIEFVENIISYL